MCRSPFDALFLIGVNVRCVGGPAAAKSRVMLKVILEAGIAQMLFFAAWRLCIWRDPVNRRVAFLASFAEHCQGVFNSIIGMTIHLQAAQWNPKTLPRLSVTCWPKPKNLETPL